MPTVTYPHCAAINAWDAMLCQSCGNTLPGYSFRPPDSPDQRWAANDTAVDLGRNRHRDDLHQKISTASITLLSVAVLQFLAAGLMFFVLQPQALAPAPDVNPDQGAIVAVIMGAVGLWHWSRTSPFPAALTGLILYGTLWMVNNPADPAGIFRGNILQILIVVVLAKAVSAGAEYRKMR